MPYSLTRRELNKIIREDKIVKLSSQIAVLEKRIAENIAMLLKDPAVTEYHDLIRKHFSKPNKSKDTRRFYRVSEMGGNGTYCIYSWTVAAESVEDALRQGYEHTGKLLDGITLVARLESE